jgi:arabinose-5-phosphate isomerase
VDRKDIVLAIGKSGESEELLNILPSVRRIGAKVISITANRHSSLARQSFIVLHTPMTREVCPLNLAPTTSTTLAVVVGDAIAIALMKLRGFDAENFALFHPGGLLGKKLLLRVSDVMRGGKTNPVVRVDAPFKTLLMEITRKWTGAASIVDRKGRLVGLVTDYDLRGLIGKPHQMQKASIRSVMNARPTFVYSDDMAVRALQIMEKRSKPFTVLPVVDRARRSVGMVHLHDLVRSGLVSGKDSPL